MGFAQRPSSALRLLLVDADGAARQTVRVALETRIARPLIILETADPAAARAMAAERGFDVIAADLATVGGIDGFAALVERAPSTMAYALGAARDVQAAVAAVRAGAADFLEKPIDGAAFARRIERQFVADRLATADAFEGLTGQSPAMLALFDQIRRVAPSAGPVLITGPAGCGKSLVARAVHARSRRRGGPFVTLDCPALAAEALIAALTANDDAAARAAGGTLFLDEVGALAAPAQAALASFLDGTAALSADGEPREPIRVVAASRRPLDALRGAGGLRDDLFFRLAVLPLEVPPLAARRDDLPVLIDALLRQANRGAASRITRLSSAAVDRLAAETWPGDVRELKQAIERLVAAHDGDLIPPEAVDAVLDAHRADGSAASRRAADIRPLWMEEARLIEEAVAAFDGNIAKAAAALEISPSTIYRKRREVEEATRHKVA